MTVIHPCRHCPHRPTCVKRAAAAVTFAESHLRVTLARLSCPEYAALYAPGDRVSAMIGSSGATTITGTITGTSVKKPGRWVVQVDENSLGATGFDGDWEGHGETDPRPFVSVYPNRMTKLDEPRREICQMCGNAKGANGEHLSPKGDGTCDQYKAAWLEDGSEF